MQDLRKLVRKQAFNCIKNISSLPAPKKYTLNVVDIADAIDPFDSISDIGFDDFDGSDSEVTTITFDSTGSTEVHIRDYIEHMLKHTSEAAEIENMYAGNIDELRSLQNEYEQLIFDLFSGTAYYADDKYETITTDYEGVLEENKYGDALFLRGCEILSLDFEINKELGGDLDADIVVGITCDFEGDECDVEFVVQTVGGFYLPQQDCLILGANGENYSGVEKVLLELYDIPGLAEHWYDVEVSSKEKYHPTGFNASVNSTSIYIKEYEGEFRIAFVNDDFSTLGYVPPETLVLSYDTLDEAMQSLDEYRTGDYHDFTGVSNAMKDLLNKDY